MSWTRPQLERLEKLQLQIRNLINEVGTDSDGADSLISANELMRTASGKALQGIERDERNAYARKLTEALRPLAQTEKGS